MGSERAAGRVGRVHCTVNSEAWRSHPADPNLLFFPYHTFFPSYPATSWRIERTLNYSSTNMPLLNYYQIRIFPFFIRNDSFPRVNQQKIGPFGDLCGHGEGGRAHSSGTQGRQKDHRPSNQPSSERQVRKPFCRRWLLTCCGLCLRARLGFGFLLKREAFSKPMGC